MSFAVEWHVRRIEVHSARGLALVEVEQPCLAPINLQSLRQFVRLSTPLFVVGPVEPRPRNFERRTSA